MNDEIFDEIEQNEAEENEITLVSDPLYIPLANKSIKVIPQAFTVPDDLPPVIVQGFTLAWEKVALGILGEIQKATRTQDKSQSKNLPYASLRGLLEVGLDNVTRLQSNLGLSQYDFSSQESKPFAYLDRGNKNQILEALRPILNDWITNYLIPFAQREDVDLKLTDELLGFYEDDNLLIIEPVKTQVLPWKWNEETETTRPRKPYDFRILIDYLARQIAGNEIFPNLGPMKRVISSSGSFTTGTTELITNPIHLENKTGKFSLIVSLELVTYPGLHQPLLKIDVSKRRWLDRLVSPSYFLGNISGFIFSEKYSDHATHCYRDRVFSYQVLCQKEKQSNVTQKEEQKKKNWSWRPDKGFEALRRKFKLPLKSNDGQDMNGEEIALGKASNDTCQVMLTHRNGLQKHDIEAGVPEIDKLEAFEAIEKIIRPIGLTPFNSYSPVKSRGESHKLDDTGSRMINWYTLITAGLQFKECSKLTAEYLKNFDENQLNKLLKKHFGIETDKIYGGKKILESKKQFRELEALIKANQTAIESFYAQEKLLLVLFYERGLQTEVKLLEALIKMLWGKTIEVIVNSLPQNTHGSKEDLPGSKLKTKERSLKRIEAWTPIVEQLALRKQRTFCLILAREYYEDSKENKSKHDDKINKPSTRQALAKIANACVQFLLPIETTKKNKELKLENFFHRAQAALKDLLFAHSGYVNDVKEKVDKWLKDLPEENRPKEIIGITIVRKQKGRVRGQIGQTFLPIALRLNVETGNSELCCAYEEQKQKLLEISSWSQFSDGISFVSRISPVKLADKQEVRQERFMKFIRETISNSVEAGKQPLVMIDSSNCVQLCPWLGDQRINANEINFTRSTGGLLYQNLEQEWEGVRIIRIRQDIAPGIIDKKERHLIETSLEDTRTVKELKKLSPDHRIPSASSKMGLFRLSQTYKNGCVAYLSIQNQHLHNLLRGLSCYRSIETLISVKKTIGKEKKKVVNKSDQAVHQLVRRSPFTEYYPTPNPIEIVVTLREPEDDPDRLALLVESLRFGFGHYSDWSSLPAPLFFERVVRDYISDFNFQDEDIIDKPK